MRTLSSVTHLCTSGVAPFNFKGRFFLTGALGLSGRSFDDTGPYVSQMAFPKNETNLDSHFNFFRLLFVFVISRVASCLAKLGNVIDNMAFPTGFPENFVPG